jgi:MFS family permease
VSQWFDARKGIATGCVTLGAPLGGIFFSLVLQTLFERYPWRTAGLVLVGIMAGLLVVGNLLVETNVLLPPSGGRQTASEDRTSERPAEATISNMLRSPKFWLVGYALFGKPCRSTRSAASFCEANPPSPLSQAYELVLFIQWGSIPSYAVSVNVGHKQFYLMMSYNM